MNDLNTATMPDDTVTIEAQEGVDIAVIEITQPTVYPGFAKTGEVVTFTVLEHSGEGTLMYKIEMYKEINYYAAGMYDLPHIKKVQTPRAPNTPFINMLQ